jgi:uncharacterized protein
MTLQEIARVLQENREELSAFGVASVSVFGSAARGEATSSSDIDLLVELARPMGIFEFVRLQNRLQLLLDSRVDLVTPDALHPELRASILREAVRAA